jgi:hypothetical protein
MIRQRYILGAYLFHHNRREFMKIKFLAATSCLCVMAAVAAYAAPALAEDTADVADAGLPTQQMLADNSGSTGAMGQSGDTSGSQSNSNAASGDNSGDNSSNQAGSSNSDDNSSDSSDDDY